MLPKFVRKKYTDININRQINFTQKIEFEEDYSEYHYSESNYQQIDPAKREDSFKEEKQGNSPFFHFTKKKK